MTFDYRAARDQIFGTQRDGDGKIVGYRPTPAKLHERALLLALVEFAPNIEPSLTTLAAMLGTDDRHVRRLLRACQAKGLLHVQRRDGCRSQYTLLTPGVFAPPGKSVGRANRTQTPGKSAPPPPTDLPSKADKKADNEADKIHAPFRLEVLGPGDGPKKPEPETPKTRKPKRTKPAAFAAGAHKQVTDCYCTAFEAQHGRKAAFDGADGSAV